jgi:hypothetical protein
MILLKTGLFSVFSLLVFHVVTSRPVRKIVNENEEENSIVLAAKTSLQSFKKL